METGTQRRGRTAIAGRSLLLWGVAAVGRKLLLATGSVSSWASGQPAHLGDWRESWNIGQPYVFRHKAERKPGQ